jgi:hypothetical protein
VKRTNTRKQTQENKHSGEWMQMLREILVTTI